MKISFVIPSYDRKEILQECIRSIENAYIFAKNVGIEIIVVFCAIKFDKASFDFKFPESTIMLFLEQNNVCRAKNTGIERASGEYIVLIDDDAVIKEDFLLILRNLINGKVKVFCAKLQDFRTKECFTKQEVGLAKKNIGRLDYNFFRGSALIIEKGVLKRAGMYNEEFGPGGVYYSAEESDLFFRIKMLKAEVHFVPELIVYHPICNMLPEAKAFKYSYATGVLLTKYCFDDWFYMPVYTFLILRIFLICAVRIVQMFLFPGKMILKNQKHRYMSVVKGITAGILQYSISRLCLH